MAKEITVEDIIKTVEDYHRLCDAAVAAGGIPQEAVQDNIATVPDGWVLEPWLHYWLPPNFKIFHPRKMHK